MDSAPGPDGLTPRLIKDLKDLFSSQAFFVFFLMFVNFCFLNAWVPEAWKSSKIFILYKGKGNPFCADSYRGIALCCILAKLFERLLLFRLQCWWRSSSLYRLSQFGFRSGSSTLDAVFVLQTLVNFVCRLNRHELHACFIHLKKAFPSVSRLATFEYLIELGVPRLLVAAIRSLYQLNVTHLRIGSFLYRKFIVTLGLLEGSVLSPLLFSIVFSFVWRVVDPLSALLGVNSAFKIDDVWILAFADDLVVLSPNRELLTRVLIQLDAEFLRFNLRSKISLFKTVALKNLLVQNSKSPPSAPNPFNFKVAMLLFIVRTGTVVWVRVAPLFTFTYYYRIENIRNMYLRTLFNLPPGTPCELFYVLWPSYHPALLCLQRRLSFFNHGLKHQLVCVPSSFIINASLLTRSCGWFHDSFLFYQTFCPLGRLNSFDFARDIPALFALV